MAEEDSGETTSLGDVEIIEIHVDPFPYIAPDESSSSGSGDDSSGDDES